MADKVTRRLTKFGMSLLLLFIFPSVLFIIVDCRAHEAGLSCVAVGKNTNIIATGGQDNRTCIWTLRQAKEKGTPKLVLFIKEYFIFSSFY